MTTIALVAADDSATDKLVHRLTRNGDKVHVATTPAEATALLAGPVDVAIVLADTHGGGPTNWHVGPAANPALTAWEVPDTIDAKLLIVAVPGAAEIGEALATRCTGSTLLAPHVKAGRDFTEDCAYLLWEFVTSAYDRYQPDAETLLGVWAEVFTTRVKQAGSYLQRTREPAQWRPL